MMIIIEKKSLIVKSEILAIGVLIRAKAAGHIDLIKPLIDQMRQTNFRISDELFKTALLQAGE